MQDKPEFEPGGRSAHLTLAVLSFAYLLSFIDRMIPALLIDPIRTDLAISDTEVSLLIGLAFALVYTTAAVPIAWLADRRSRKLVLITGVCVWGSLTAVCGMASGFAQFFVGRMGVGLGEAALTPTAYALVTDLYPPHQRSRAMSVFVVGGAAGAGIALLAGAAALDLARGVDGLAPWRIVLIGLGTLTMLMIVPLSRIANPSRPGVKDAAGEGHFGHLVLGMWRERRAFAALFVAVPLMNLTLYGSAAWGPTLLIRRYHWDAVDVGAWLGGTQLALGIAGTLLFGWLGDRALRRHGTAALLPLLAVSCVIAAIAIGSLAVWDSANGAIVLLGVMTLATGSVGVLGPVALQAVSDPTMRAQTASLWLLVANLVGIGAGPSSVALVNDRIFMRPDALADAMALVCAPALLLGAIVTWWFAKDYAKRAQMIEAQA